MSEKVEVQCFWCYVGNFVPRDVTSTGYETRFRCHNCRETQTQIWNVPRSVIRGNVMEDFEKWKETAKKAGVYDARIVEGMTNSKRILMGDI